jgi:chromosome segregation ATPase
MSSVSSLFGGALAWLKVRKASMNPDAAESSERHVATLEQQYAGLSERLFAAEQRLIERSELLYELQQLYSSEHFALQESMRDLKIERMRNAGAYAQLNTTMERARALQARVADLKTRLRRHEAVDDAEFDAKPILIEQDAAHDGN